MPGKRGRCECSNGAVATDGDTLRLALATFLCSVPAFLPTLATLCWIWSEDTESRTDGIVHEPVDSPGYALLVIREVTIAVAGIPLPCRAGRRTTAGCA
jgi:hypothetical protein